MKGFTLPPQIIARFRSLSLERLEKLEAAWATPWKPLTVVGDFVYGSPLWLDLPFRGGFSTRFGVNAVVSIESMMPARGNP